MSLASADTQASDLHLLVDRLTKRQQSHLRLIIESDSELTPAQNTKPYPTNGRNAAARARFRALGGTVTMPADWAENHGTYAKTALQTP